MSARNQFPTAADAVDFPSSRLLAITPDDANELEYVVKALHIGTGGTLAIVAVLDTDPVTLTVQDGTILPVRAKKVLATGTTATGIVGLL